MTIGSAIILIVLLGLYIGFELATVGLVKAIFRRLGRWIERRDRAALGLPPKDEKDRSR